MACLDETGLAHFWQQILGRLNNFVRAEEGKGLSTNDLTDTLKSNYDAAYNYSISAHAPKTVPATLLASNWTGASAPYTYTLAVTDVTASSNGSLRIAQSATDEQFTAWGAAQLRVTAQAAGTLTVKATGTVPTIDIPVEVLIV